jgi:hypothetical protein
VIATQDDLRKAGRQEPRRTVGMREPIEKWKVYIPAFLLSSGDSWFFFFDPCLPWTIWFQKNQPRMARIRTNTEQLQTFTAGESQS